MITKFLWEKIGSLDCLDERQKRNYRIHRSQRAVDFIVTRSVSEGFETMNVSHSIPH